MKLNISTLETIKLEAMAARLRERIQASPTNSDETNLARIEKELKHRAMIRLSVEEELNELDTSNSHYNALREEILLRGRLQLTDNHTRDYEVLYHKWFSVREQGVRDGSYPFFTPPGKRRVKRSVPLKI